MLPFFWFGNPLSCTYCGAMPATRDHVIPISLQTNRRVRQRENQTNGPWCWACRDCNNHLSDRYFDTFKARCQWDHDRIAKKVKPVIWHDWELEEMDHSIASHIRRDTAKRKWTALRADFFQSRDFYLNLESLLWKVPQSSDFLSLYFASVIIEIAQIYKPSNANTYGYNE